jgi:hypothetical protein
MIALPALDVFRIIALAFTHAQQTPAISITFYQ